MPRLCLLLGTALLSLAGGIPQKAAAAEEEVKIIADTAYKSGPALTEYERTRCKLDLYVPQGGEGRRPCLVWFHGGGLTGGDKARKETAAVAASLAREGVVVISVNYRLSPEARFPAYLEDAAAAVAWVHRHAAEHGGDPQRVFVAGHSAGGYLTAMLAMDPRYLAAQQMQPGDIAGYIPISGQMTTHFTVREERGIPRSVMVVDAAAPLHHVRKDTPPLLVLYAGHDLPLRAEENRFFCEALRAAGCLSLTSMEIREHDHGGIGHRLAEPRDQGRLELLAFIQKISASLP